MIAAIERRDDLSLARRRNLTSNLRWLPKFVGLLPELVAADLKVAHDILARTAPAAFGVSKRNFANIGSGIRGAFRVLRLTRQPPAGMSSAFRALFERIPTRELGYRLSRPFTFWSSEGLEPGDVGARGAGPFRRLLPSSFREVEATQARSRRRPRLGQLRSHDGGLAAPAAFRADVAAGLDPAVVGFPFSRSSRTRAPSGSPRRRGDDLPDDESLTRRLRPATLRKVAFSLREVGSALVRAGVDIAEIRSLAILVQPDNFRKICQFLLDRHGGPTEHIHDVARELAFMARHHAKLPDCDLTKLRGICRRLRIKRTGPTATVRERLRAIEEPRNLYRLVLLPSELMERANKVKRAPLKAARMAQTAVGIELLLMTAIRRKNLAGLRLGRHVLLGNDPKQPKARMVLYEAGGETKNGQPLEFELPEASVRMLHTYIHRHLPAYAAPGQDYVFPGKNGRAKRPDNLAEQISKAIGEHVGCKVNVHLFRALTGRAFLRRNPGHYEVLRRVLGHQSSDTTITYYTGLETEDAARHFDKSILELREQARQAALPRRRRGPHR